MLKKNYQKFSFLLLFISIISCNSSSELQKDFNCSSSSYSNLEEVEDFKKVFTVQLPKNWKTNLYYDNVQSTIYSADTTKQLTETTIFDFNLVQKAVSFNDKFQLELESENLAKGLISTQKKVLKLGEKPSFYMLSKGKKQNFPYQKLNIFKKLNNENFINIKIEVYGDKLIEERLCKAISLVEKIALK